MITKSLSKNSFFKFVTLLFFSFFMLNFFNLIIIKFTTIILDIDKIQSANVFYTFLISVVIGAYFFLFSKEFEIVVKTTKNTKYFTLKESIKKISKLDLSKQLLFISMIVLILVVMLIFTLGLSLYVFTIFQSRIIVFLFIFALLMGILMYILAIIKSQQFLHLLTWELPWKT